MAKKRKKKLKVKKKNQKIALLHATKTKLNNLKKMVKALGINATQFNKCLNNQVIEDQILRGRIDGHQKYSIDSTPTIIINEKKFEGSANFKNIKKKIENII